MTQPQPAQPVRLSIDGLGEVSARVQDAGDGRLALVLGVDLEARIEALTHRHAQVEFETKLGLYRLSGDVQAPSASGVVELSIAEEERIQRRNDARVHVVRPVAVLADGAAEQQDAATVDVSGGGLLIAGPAGLGVGDRLAFALELDAGPAIGGQGEVVRRTAEGHSGVRIDRISTHERELLVRFVFASERQRRRLGLA